MDQNYYAFHGVYIYFGYYLTRCIKSHNIVIKTKKILKQPEYTEELHSITKGLYHNFTDIIFLSHNNAHIGVQPQFLLRAESARFAKSFYILGTSLLDVLS